MTIDRFSIFLPVIRSAFSTAASVTTAVPCWSSWNTGMSSASLSASSTWKAPGAAMSSRLIPPNVGASRMTVSMISSGLDTSRQIGNASTPANSLNSRALPSITGIAPFGPMSPRPSTAVPSDTMATVFLRIVYTSASDSSAAMALQTRATPGV